MANAFALRASRTAPPFCPFGRRAVLHPRDQVTTVLINSIKQKKPKQIKNKRPIISIVCDFTSTPTNITRSSHGVTFPLSLSASCLILQTGTGHFYLQQSDMKSVSEKAKSPEWRYLCTPTTPTRHPTRGVSYQRGRNSETDGKGLNRPD